MYMCIYIYRCVHVDHLPLCRSARENLQVKAKESLWNLGCLCWWNPIEQFCGFCRHSVKHVVHLCEEATTFSFLGMLVWSISINPENRQQGSDFENPEIQLELQDSLNLARLLKIIAEVSLRRSMGSRHTIWKRIPHCVLGWQHSGKSWTSWTL